MKRTILLMLAILLVSPLVFAVGEKTFTWQPPTEYDDNTPLPNVEIKEYRLYCDGNSTPVHVQPNVPLDTDTWQAPANTFPVGSHSCEATAVSVDEVESARSNAVAFIVAPGVPKAPILAVQ